MDDAFVEYFTDQALALQGQESNGLSALRRQLADTEKAIDNMLNAIQAGIFNASTKRRLDELEATKEKLELRIIKEEMKKPQFTREQNGLLLNRSSVRIYHPSGDQRLRRF